jgi:hypothetical protein
LKESLKNKDFRPISCQTKAAPLTPIDMENITSMLTKKIVTI